ncbi:MAG: hypothetical protein HY267_02215 [Deltaproteobacteria bacterium]|nr:hypothetical protein [Deltaproteobacteria bacterium]
MRTYHLSIGLTLLMLTSVVGISEAKTRHMQCKGSTTFVDGVETHLDTNGDGVSAGSSQGIENCNIGRFFLQDEAEWIVQPTVTTCPAGTGLEYHIDQTGGQHRLIATDEKTADQLYIKITSAALCLSFSPPSFLTFTVSGQTENIGGTGKYTGASGTAQFRGSGSYLMFGFKGGVFGGFGQSNFTSEGTLILPNDNDD